MKRKCLITGSCGFIFSNFIRKAIYEKSPYNFVSIDKITKSNTLNNIYINNDHEFHIADITDAHTMNVLFEYVRPEIVIHGAAETFVDTSLKDPNSFINANVLGTQIIVNNCVKWEVKKLIYISTDEVYGQLTNENDLSWIEDAPLNPRNPYSASKAAGELLVRAANASYGLTYNITRSSNNYGPRQTGEKLIPKIIKCILNNEKIPVYGQGLQIRDWTHVYDNCGAILQILSSGKDNEIYNISANQEFTNIEVVQRICNIMERGHNLIEHIKDPRTGHDFRYSINTDKIRSLGWKPNYKFKEGLYETVQWFMNNQWYLNM
jgi:dTDP-glucose 4,6-dehydratase